MRTAIDPHRDRELEEARITEHRREQPVLCGHKHSATAVPLKEVLEAVKAGLDENGLGAMRAAIT